MWLAQVPNLALAYHSDGQFAPADVEVKDVRKHVNQWGNSHAEDVRKFVVLLRRLVQIAPSVFQRKGGTLL
jgi:hypothetical protein